MRKMEETQQQTPSHSGGADIGPGLLIVAAIIVVVFVVSALIHVILRFFTKKSSSAASTGADSPIFLPAMSPPAAEGKSEKDLMDSLPLFTLASALAAAPKSSPDCAVCLSRFELSDQLRLLPNCRHAFHSSCIDTWLKSNLSCPLCRSSIVQEVLPPPANLTTSGSFRVEIGSVSRRLNPSDDARSYSLGSSFHYVVEEEVDAVIDSIAANIREQRRKERMKDLRRLAPGDSVAEAAGGANRSWLMEYMERFASSASSSFSSLRFAGCGSRRINADVITASSSAVWPDLESRLQEQQQQQQQEDDDVGSLHSFFRWLVGT